MTRSRVRLLGAVSWLAASALLLSSCTGPRPRARPEGARRLELVSIRALVPRSVPDRSAWAADIRAGFDALDIPRTRENVCAVVAVIEQESGFRVDPVIPDLGRIARREIDERASDADVPRVLVHAALDLKSSNGRSYGERIRSARTEKQLSDIFEDFIGQVPLGRQLFSGWNPIRTRGPMQVNVAFAEKFAAVRPYPFHTERSIGEELFTRRGSIYFGIAHLLDYHAPYGRFLYRFADYNAGQYASRNAAFQWAAAIAAGRPLTPDGALLAHDRSVKDAGSTERVLDGLAGRLHLSAADIHAALAQGATRAFGQTALYRRVFALAERRAGRRLPRAVIPRIQLHGPKIERALTTGWYAHRVNGRFERCVRG